MNCLVVIPTNLNRYSFSGPLAWLFAAYASDVRGVYSEELTPDLVRNAECVVVELNWVTQLKEFLLITEFIRRHNPAARILFGGAVRSPQVQGDLLRRGRGLLYPRR